MSHFAVLVIGPDFEKQLAPYHEFESTGDNNEFVQDVDITDELRGHMAGDEPMTLQEALEYHGLEERVVEREDQVDTGAGSGYVKDESARAPHMWGYAIAKDGQLIKAVKRTNPNKTWDWWIVGGRFGGHLRLKRGAAGKVCKRSGALLDGTYALISADDQFADQATKGSLDIEGARAAAGVDAAAKWDKAAAVIAGREWRTWQEVLGCRGNIGAAREEYWSQPVVADLEKVFDRFYGRFEQYKTPRDVYIQEARDGALSTYALVKDGQWFARGKMGWWAMSDDKMTQQEWNQRLNEVLDSLPDDTLLTVVDCHI